MEEKHDANDHGFTDIYKPGDNIWYARHTHETTEILYVKVRTVYPDMLVCLYRDGVSHCVGYKHRDRLFNSMHEAEEYCRHVQKGE